MIDVLTHYELQLDFNEAFNNSFNLLKLTSSDPKMFWVDWKTQAAKALGSDISKLSNNIRENKEISLVATELDISSVCREDVEMVWVPTDFIMGLALTNTVEVDAKLDEGYTRA